ncbi:hypothetical protein CDD80_4122 [Ophiocordyceps camponoti-rufipedis]|uniref:Transcription factor 25 n=1 Tax=Ophiocordyceps camponoti-rufipedis TaxID=2004952 RepID=A0A2C5Y4G7_9HYPO|nr:hypothetical protein CDD80_4122 [Ophiocordyceps camponoti-rufipedis]
MSSRQLRKLQQQRELEKAQDSPADEVDSDHEDDEATIKKPRPNLFAALGGEDEEEDQDEDASAGEQDEAQPHEAENTVKKQGRKKKKKKKKGTTAERHNSEEPEQDEIDKALKELRIDLQQNHGASAGDELPQRTNDLLGVNTHHLRDMNEMMNIFGREVIESAHLQNQEASGRRTRAHAQQHVDLETFLREPPGAPMLSEVSLRRNPFVQGREHWPRQSAGGMTMEQISKAPDGLSTEYAFVHNKDYDGVQAFFFASAQIGDPMRLVYLLKQYPYHVSTLLQVSLVAQVDQNMALAAELCERALFTFGRVTTVAFKRDLECGCARLNFQRPENRQFWLAGYLYIKSLVRKGTFRTALEWARLLYSMDPADPYAMRHRIHGLAVRAHESSWLVDFVRHLEQRGDIQDVIYLRQTLVLALLQMEDGDGARHHLKRGLEQLPWLYCSLFQELNLDTPQAIWGISPESNERTFWTKLYIKETKELWNNAQATALLQEVARDMDRVDATMLASHDPPLERAIVRQAMLDGEGPLLALAPRELVESQPNYEFDPLPPPEEDNLFTARATQLPWRDRQQQDEEQDPELMARMNNLLAHHAELAAVLDDDDDDDEIRALRQADDDELQRDLEAHRARADQPGMLAALMQALGLGRETAADVPSREDDDPSGVPGAWPPDGDGGDDSARHRRG